MKRALAVFGVLGVLGGAGCGWISPVDHSLRWDVDQDGVERPTDCDDQNPRVSPEHTEVCDGAGIDEDCDALADDDDPDCGALDETDTPDTADPPDETCGDPPIAALEVADPAGEQGITVFSADASGSRGTELRYRFDWGDGPGPLGSLPTSTHAFDAPGWLSVAVEVEDGCGRTDAAIVRLAVAAPGSLLRVDTPNDEDDPETFPPGPSGWLGAGLSLREALAIARDAAGTQVISVASELGQLPVADHLPELSDASGILIGAGGSTLVASGDGPLDVTGPGAIVSGLALSGFGGPEGALRLEGAGALAHRVTVRDSERGIRVKGDRARVEESLLVGNGGPQLVLEAPADLVAVDVADGAGDGIEVKKEASGSTLVSCIVRGNAGSGVVLKKEALGVAILDSTLVDNGANGLSVDEAEGLDLRNVVLARNAGWGLGGRILSWAPGAPGYDLWFGNEDGDCAECASLGEGALTVDPLLADGVPLPLPGSPLVDAGTEATGVDRNGASPGLWFGDGPDIGAIEVR